uniref:Uncharacterized protein n=1 Tax=Trichobilharzia regenti TaxID=157069 RepID=A0AA85JM06_TRIRE|nr:unnamed protein product [Trichobilharzia regenti]
MFSLGHMAIGPVGGWMFMSRCIKKGKIVVEMREIQHTIQCRLDTPLIECYTFGYNEKNSIVGMCDTDGNVRQQNVIFSHVSHSSIHSTNNKMRYLSVGL